MTNRQRVKMSDNSKKTVENSKSQQDLGQKVTDVKKEIEDIINSVGEEKESMVKRVKEARDKWLMEWLME